MSIKQIYENFSSDFSVAKIYALKLKRFSWNFKIGKKNYKNGNKTNISKDKLERIMFAI